MNDAAGAAAPETISSTGVSADDLQRGARCLPDRGVGLNLSYPNDAEAHFEAIHAALATYTENERPHRGAGYGVSFHYRDFRSRLNVFFSLRPNIGVSS